MHRSSAQALHKLCTIFMHLHDRLLAGSQVPCPAKKQGLDLSGLQSGWPAAAHWGIAMSGQLDEQRSLAPCRPCL